MPVIAFANMKGGVGKTTLCVNLAFELFSRGRRKILIVDNDPQFNASSSLLTPKNYIENCLNNKEQHTIYDIYEKPPRIYGAKTKKFNPKNFFIRTWYMKDDPTIRLDLIPSRIELYETLRNPSQKEYLLNKFLIENAKEYDYILIDCPPTPSVLTLSAFAASDFILIPVTPNYYATLGLPQFIGTLKDFKTDLQDPHNVKALGVIFTNVPRKASPETRKAIERVATALSETDEDIPIFKSKVSYFKVYEKSLWQARPVQRVAGRWTRGATEAGAEIKAIADELIDNISKV
jgi:chromosome partitioning protein